MVTVAASEYALFVDAIEVALWGHFLTLLFALVVGYRLEEESTAFGAFALLSTFRLVNFGLPPIAESALLRLVLVYGPFLCVFVLFARATDTLPLRGDQRRVTPLLPVVVALGVVSAHFEYAIIRPEPLIEVWTLGQAAILIVVMVLFVGVVEELLFRVLLQRSLQQRIGRVPGIVLASAFFGLMHSSYGSGEEIAFAAIVGLLFGLVYDLTDDLVLVAVFHGVLNVVLFGYIPLAGPLF